MKLLRYITDEDITGGDGFSYALPRRAARAAVLDGEGRIAVMYLRSIDLYTLPGGGIENGEDVTDALSREILEETGCEFEVEGKLGYTIENRSEVDFTQHSYYFYGSVKGEKGNPCFTEEEIADGTSVGWYALLRARELVLGKRHESYQCRFIQARDTATLDALDEILSK